MINKNLRNNNSNCNKISKQLDNEGESKLGNNQNLLNINIIDDISLTSINSEKE